MEALQPRTESEVREMIADALAARTPLEIRGAGTKRALGPPMNGARVLDLTALNGIPLYEPDELILRALPGTPLREVEARLTQHGQMLAFEPPDYGALLGTAPGAQTIGGVIACNLSGPRRLKAGAARDHFLGFRAVSGRGEVFKSGGRVVKNVTGYDLCKLMAGSCGTLAALTETTMKVLPAPEKMRTVLVCGLDDARAIEAMAAALGGPHEVSAAAHLPQRIAATSQIAYVAGARAPVTALRVEGFAASAEARCHELRDAMARFGPVEELHSMNARTFWREVGDVAAFAPDALGGNRAIWRASVPPASGAAVAAGVMGSHDTLALYDWGGGLVWLAVAGAADGGASAVRAAVRGIGHATLVRALPGMTAPRFEPEPPPLAALSARIKDAFDPERILNPGRLGV
jgi:glycolate oxidase FAD binding subunit